MTTTTTTTIHVRVYRGGVAVIDVGGWGGARVRDRIAPRDDAWPPGTQTPELGGAAARLFSRSYRGVPRFGPDSRPFVQPQRIRVGRPAII